MYIGYRPLSGIQKHLNPTMHKKDNISLSRILFRNAKLV